MLGDDGGYLWIGMQQMQEILTEQHSQYAVFQRTYLGRTWHIFQQGALTEELPRFHDGEILPIQRGTHAARKNKVNRLAFLMLVKDNFITHIGTLVQEVIERIQLMIAKSGKERDFTQHNLVLGRDGVAEAAE